ncbi:MAG: ATP-binding cassette domain-containing protein [Gemmataceae bacterium]|nr:ATP-binding cassette domain-containing protein [Gemmataceae bacterium]
MSFAVQTEAGEHANQLSGSTGGHGGPHVAHVSPMGRLLGLLRAERSDLWLILIFTLGVGLLSLATPIAIEFQFVYVQYSTFMQPVVVLAVVVLVLLGLDAAIRAMRTFVVEILQRRIFVRVVGELAHRLPRVRCQVYESAEGPEIGNRFFDVFLLQKAGAILLIDGLTLVVQTLVSLFVLAVYHPLLLGYDVVLIFVVSFIIFTLGRGAIRSVVRQSIAKYEVAGWLEEMTRQPVAFKLSGGPQYAVARADQLTRDYLLKRMEYYRILFRQILFSLVLQAVAGASLLSLGSYLVIQGQLTRPQLLAAELIVAVLIGSFTKLGKSLESFYDLMASMDKLGHLVDLPLERGSGEGHVVPAGGAALNIRNLAFAHEGSHRLILVNQNWAVKAGERVAIVGPFGSGKTTLMELLVGLREPVQGNIELDGVDLRDIHLDTLREQVGTVMGYEIFKATVVENVRVGRLNVSLADVRAALARAGLLEDVLALPRGLQTPLAPNGAPLSNKQARRLMLARAIAVRPRLLVLDELLDSLDDPIRNVVMDGLFDRQAPWTLLVATYHPDVMARCDRRISLEDQPDTRHASQGPGR